jgi:transcriptional regulator with XRE-family HTH domain
VARRPPSTRTKPPAGWPAWLAEQRLAKGWKQQDVFDRVRDHFEWGENSLSLYGDIERGKRELTLEDKTVLAAVYNKVPSDVPEPPTIDPTPDLAAALVALTSELAAIRLEREAWTRGVAEVLRSYADGRVPTELLDALVPPPHVDAQP